MGRPELRRYRIEEGDVVEMLAVLAPFLPILDVPVPRSDRDDMHVVAGALVGRAEAIITVDQGLIEDADLRKWLDRNRVALLTPAEAIELLPML